MKGLWPFLTGAILTWQFSSLAPADQTSQSAAHSNGNAGSAISPQAQINELIEQLGAPSYIQREAAKTELETYGLLAFESLNAAEMHPNVEIAHNATYLLQSMRVVWTLPTDSFDVQRLLKDYNEFPYRSKHEALQRLAKLDRGDGYVALLRLVRYDKDERISKYAALAVLEAAVNSNQLAASTKNDSQPAASQALANTQPRPAKHLDWPQLITSGLGDSHRVAAQWLLTLSSEIDSPDTPLTQWQHHATHERMLLESNARSKSSQSQTDDQIVKQLYRLIAKLMLSRGQRGEALAFFEPCLELVAQDKSSAFQDLQWMLEAGLPEAVLTLDAQRPNLLKDRSRHRYLLAESHLRVGNQQEADRVAQEASELSTLRPLNNGQAAISAGDSEARLRDESFDFLLERNLFSWAEAELLRTLQKDARRGEYSAASELKARDKLSQFYWDGDEPDKAAKIWYPLLQRAGLIDEARPGTPDKDLLSEMTLRSNGNGQFIVEAPSRYYFYLGLAASQAKDWPAAREHLTRAWKYDANNPDILIAMHRARGDDENFQTQLNAAIERLETAYRDEIAKGESQIAQSVSRNIRQDHERALAEQLNQLAWLLAGTERKPNEAITLSQRSVAIQPDEAIYLDTLARCYFADKQIDRAIQLQQLAVEKMPYQRTMQRQLAEFQAARAVAAE